MAHAPDVLRDFSEKGRGLLVAQYRDNPLEGIVDAYLLGNVLNLVLGDLRLESIPIDEIPKLRRGSAGPGQVFERSNTRGGPSRSTAFDHSNEPRRAQAR